MRHFLLTTLTATTLLAGGAAMAQSADRPAPPPPHGRDFFAEMDTNQDGVVTRTEVNAVFEKRFAALDSNHDGVISAAERKAAFDAKREERLTPNGRSGSTNASTPSTATKMAS